MAGESSFDHRFDQLQASLRELVREMGPVDALRFTDELYDRMPKDGVLRNQEDFMVALAWVKTIELMQGFAAEGAEE